MTGGTQRCKMKSISEATIAILRRLLSQKKIGSHGLPVEVCTRWIKNLSPKAYKIALKDLEQCKKEKLVLTTYGKLGKHYSINPRKLKKVYELITQ